ncbi:cellulose binding domain-containing protein [Phytohabitans rumicis]|uniref:cellulose binding domain-containing protein n=1 Tax=Phytohabitans rumicis TaxID=1076125 RepID=UPI001565DBCC|nr:cellulose binding domain-containing protein [Phytohabitans rumicis]
MATALVLGVTAITFFPAPASAATSVFVKESQWSTGYVGKMTVTNNTTTAITTWRVEFDLPAGTTIASHWSAALTRSGSRYVMSNLPWNGNLGPGAATSFGWVASGTGEPTNCTVNGGPCTGAPVLDVRPPSKPTNLRLTALGMTSIYWDASTDDTGVVGYDVFANGTKLATTTNTNYPLGTLPSVPTTYGIRAVDAAGNLSAFAVTTIGSPTDAGPPSAPTNLRLSGPISGYFPVRWDASTDDVFVAGYELFLNGGPVGTVGGTSGYVPYNGFGTYWIGVRAFDSSGKYSAVTQIGIAIDPPPPPV